jgi:isopenicillin N synthase-like dioxygenase
MNYAEVRRIAISEIPVIDIAPLWMEGAGHAVAGSLRRASSEVGFFYVRNHGVPEPVVVRADAAARRFFKLPIDDKQRVCINRHHHGFLRIGEAKMATDAKVDLKESFVWGLDLPEEDPERATNPFLGPNNWPDFMPELRAALYPFFEAMTDCAKMLMRAFAVSLGLPEDTFLKNCAKPISRSSTIYYPPQPPSLGREQFGVAPHTDYGCLTLLWQDDVGGLEVQNVAGEWLTAHPIPGTLVVNVGDLLARWTNDKFVSTPHRVVNRRGLDRHSMVLAFDPDFDTIVDPVATCGPSEQPKYDPVSCGEYVLSRFDAAFAYRQRNEIGPTTRELR